jgi:hypothetical protein
MKKQLGIVVFEPFQKQFLSAYARSRVTAGGMPSLPPMFFYTLRNWKDATARSKPGNCDSFTMREKRAGPHLRAAL